MVRILQRTDYRSVSPPRHLSAKDRISAADIRECHHAAEYARSVRFGVARRFDRPPSLTARSSPIGR